MDTSGLAWEDYHRKQEVYMRQLRSGQSSKQVRKRIQWHSSDGCFWPQMFNLAGMWTSSSGRATALVLSAALFFPSVFEPAYQPQCQHHIWPFALDLQQQPQEKKRGSSVPKQLQADRLYWCSHCGLFNEECDLTIQFLDDSREGVLLVSVHKNTGFGCELWLMFSSEPSIMSLRHGRGRGDSAVRRMITAPILVPVHSLLCCLPNSW